MIKLKGVNPLFIVLPLLIFLIGLYIYPHGRKAADSRLTAEQKRVDRARPMESCLCTLRLITARAIPRLSFSRAAKDMDYF